MNVQVIGNRVLVEREQVQNRTSSGIYMPETSVKAPNRGKIVGVGDGSNLSSHLVEGASVVFGEFAGMELTIGERKVVVLNNDDVIAVVA